MIILTMKRKERGWSQLELSRRTKIAPADLCRFESRRLFPYPSQLRRLAKALAIPVSEADQLLEEVEREVMQ